MRICYERVETVEKPVTERGGLVHARQKRTTTTVVDPHGSRTTTKVETVDRHCPSAGGLAWLAFFGVCVAIFFWANACLAVPMILILAVPASRVVARLGEVEPDATGDATAVFVAVIGLLGALWLVSTFPSMANAPITPADLALGRDRTKEPAR